MKHFYCFPCLASQCFQINTFHVVFVLILTFIDEDVWLARVVYASGVAAVALNGLDDSNTSSSRSSNDKRGAAMYLISIAPIVAMLAGPIMGVLYVGATYFLYDGLRGLLLGDDADSRASRAFAKKDTETGRGVTRPTRRPTRRLTRWPMR